MLEPILYNSDCFHILENNIEDKSIDLILTDPPYIHVHGGASDKKVNSGVYARDSKIRKMSDSNNKDLFDKNKIYKWLDLCELKMKKMNMYIFCSKLQIPYYLDWCVDNKYQFDVLIWDKLKTGILSHKSFATNIEYIIRIYQYGCPLNKVFNNEILDSPLYQKIHRVKPISKKNHEAEKPVELLERFVKLSSNENETILDCFLGSGSTGEASILNQRNFIGIENDVNAFNTAKKRIDTVLCGHINT